MSTTHRVTFGNVAVTGYWNSGTGDAPEARVTVYTDSGQARIAVVDERDLLKIAREAIEAVEKLRIRARHVEKYAAGMAARARGSAAEQ